MVDTGGLGEEWFNRSHVIAPDLIAAADLNPLKPGSLAGLNPLKPENLAGSNIDALKEEGVAAEE